MVRAASPASDEEYVEGEEGIQDLVLWSVGKSNYQRKADHRWWVP